MVPTITSIDAASTAGRLAYARPLSRTIFALLMRCCTAALCAALIAPVALAQEKTSTQGAGKPQSAKPKPAGVQPQKPAAGAQQGASAEVDSAGVKAIEAIFACVAQGLPEGWRRAWVIVSELSGGDKERTFEGRFFVSLEAKGEKRWDFVPCNAREVAERVYGLNDFLELEKRQWKVATLLFTHDGKFELKYDYTK